MTGQGSGPTGRYRAFISYSHQDLVTAVRLHRHLEGYRLPERLVGTVTQRGTVPARLTPIFRDIDELPASDDLTVEIKNALSESAALIVLCSPDAKASRWVNREIELFRELHPDRPILPALLRGEPDESFPPALFTPGPDGTPREPVASDMRGEQERLGRIKRIAGLTGVAVDDLVQRDAQRRLRRVMAVTASAVIAIVILSGLLIAALRAREEAERQQAEAEGKWKRVTVTQVQLCCYFTGYTEIYDFREQMKDKLSDKFDLKQFHEDFLSYGSAPVKFIKQLMLSK